MTPNSPQNTSIVVSGQREVVQISGLQLTGCSRTTALNKRARKPFHLRLSPCSLVVLFIYRQKWPEAATDGWPSGYGASFRISFQSLVFGRGFEPHSIQNLGASVLPVLAVNPFFLPCLYLVSSLAPPRIARHIACPSSYRSDRS